MIHHSLYKVTSIFNPKTLLDKEQDQHALHYGDVVSLDITGMGAPCLFHCHFDREGFPKAVSYLTSPVRRLVLSDSCGTSTPAVVVETDNTAYGLSRFFEGGSDVPVY